MKWLGFREVAVKSLHVDAVDTKRRQALQHVKDLAEDIRGHGGEPIHAPTVREGSKALLCGRDRFAATLLNGAKKLWVHMVECDDQEAKELELAENIYRRADNRAELIASLVKLREQHLRAQDDAKRAAGEKVSNRTQDSPIARARKEVAKAAGISPRTVEDHQRRANETPGFPGAQIAQLGELTDDALPKDFRSFGLETTQVQRAQVATAREHLADMEGDVRHLMRTLADLETLGYVAPAHVQAIRTAAQTLGHAVREAVPAGLCWYCKARPELKENCAGCGGTGFVGRHAGDHVPAELKRTDVVHVAVNGELVPLAAHASGAPVARPAKNGKPLKVDVVGEDGVVNELTLERDGLPGADEEVPF
jgi:hypothetical protein